MFVDVQSGPPGAYFKSVLVSSTMTEFISCTEKAHTWWIPHKMKVPGTGTMKVPLCRRRWNLCFVSAVVQRWYMRRSVCFLVAGDACAICKHDNLLYN